MGYKTCSKGQESCPKEYKTNFIWAIKRVPRDKKTYPTSGEVGSMSQPGLVGLTFMVLFPNQVSISITGLNKSNQATFTKCNEKIKKIIKIVKDMSNFDVFLIFFSCFFATFFCNLDHLYLNYELCLIKQSKSEISKMSTNIMQRYRDARLEFWIRAQC